MTHPTHAERIARVRDYLLDLRAKVRGFDLAVKALNGGDYDAATGGSRCSSACSPIRSRRARTSASRCTARRSPRSSRRRAFAARPTSIPIRARARSSCAPARSSAAGLKQAPKIDERMIKRGDGRVSRGARHRSQLRLRAGEPRRRARRSEGSPGRARGAREGGAHGAAVEGGVEQSRRGRGRDRRHARARSKRSAKRPRSTAATPTRGSTSA